MFTPDPVLFSFHIYGSQPIDVTAWTVFGLLLGNTLFSARVLIQWIASERQKKSIAPATYWWTSLAATCVMILYCIEKFETERGVVAFLLGYSISIVPYSRNLILIYSPKRIWHVVSFAVCALVFAGAVLLLTHVFAQGVRALAPAVSEQVASLSGIRQYLVLSLGVTANLIWSTRFIPQWIYSEKKGKSSLPLWFWIWSLVGQVLCLIYALCLYDLVFILGFLFNGIPIARNIMLIREHGHAVEQGDEAGA